MSRQLFTAELGLRITDENSATGIDFIQGTGAPGGDTGIQDAAGIGSIYSNRTNGSIFKKIANAGALADWVEIGNVNLDDLRWRNEVFRAATNDTLAAGNYDPTAWSDNDSGLSDDDFVVGDLILGDADGTPALWKVTAINQGVGTDEITIAAADQALAEGDKFIVRNYLPDSGADQEGAALLLYGSGSMIKVADMDWEIAKGIFLSSGYSAVNGTVVASESVESAIQKIVGNQDDIQTTSGVAQGATDYGTFTGDSLADSQTSKQLFQRVETLLEQMRGVQVAGITTAAQVDAVPVASVKTCKWLVEAFETATPANRECVEVYAATDGTNVDDTVYAKLKLGASFGLTIAVDIDSGNMRLMAGASASATVTARRIEVVKSVL